MKSEAPNDERVKELSRERVTPRIRSQTLLKLLCTQSAMCCKQDKTQLLSARNECLYK